MGDKPCASSVNEPTQASHNECVTRFGEGSLCGIDPTRAGG